MGWRLPLLSARVGHWCQYAHPTLGTLPTSVSQRAQSPDAPCRQPIPTQPGMPPLAKTLWAWVCVVVGGGSYAREPGKVCLVCFPGRGKNWGATPHHSPLSRHHPPRLPSLSGLLDRPSQWAAFVKPGPVSSLHHLWWGKTQGDNSESSDHLPSVPKGTCQSVSTITPPKGGGTGRLRQRQLEPSSADLRVASTPTRGLRGSKANAVGLSWLKDRHRRP